MFEKVQLNRLANCSYVMCEHELSVSQRKASVNASKQEKRRDTLNGLLFPCLLFRLTTDGERVSATSLVAGRDTRDAGQQRQQQQQGKNSLNFLVYFLFKSGKRKQQ